MTSGTRAGENNRDNHLGGHKRRPAASHGAHIVRLKRLGGEFDPVCRVFDNVSEQASNYFTDSLSSKNIIMLVAVSGKRVIGILRAELTNGLFYEPSVEGLIKEEKGAVQRDGSGGIEEVEGKRCPDNHHQV